MSGFEQAKDRALRYLSHRDRTCAELRAKLMEEGFEADAAEQVIDLLKAYNYLDDARFAAEYLRERVEHSGYGLERAKTELLEKGVEPFLVEETLQNEDIDESRAAKKILAARLRGGAISGEAQKKKYISFLLRRGFSWETVQLAMQIHDAE